MVNLYGSACCHSIDIRDEEPSLVRKTIFQENYLPI